MGKKKEIVVVTSEPIILPLDEDLIEAIRGYGTPWLVVEYEGTTEAEAMQAFIDGVRDIEGHGGPILRVGKVERR